jgi:hypothetical protein
MMAGKNEQHDMHMTRIGNYKSVTYLRGLSQYACYTFWRSWYPLLSALRVLTGSGAEIQL